MSRRVRVQVAGQGTPRELCGLAAEVVACVSVLDLSDRTLGLLLALCLHEPEIAALSFGRLEADLTPNRAAVYQRRMWERRRLGQEEDHADGP